MPASRDPSFIPTRRSLLSRLKNRDDQQSWQEFDDIYRKLLYNFACKAGLGPADAEDVVQETFKTLARKMPDFRYDPAIGSFKGWLRTVTERKVKDRFRQLARQPAAFTPPSGTTTSTRAVEKIIDPAPPALEQIWEEEWRQYVRDAATARVKGKASPRQYQIYDCYVNKDWPPARVAERLGVSLQQVYNAKHRVEKLLREEARKVEARHP